ncbi:Peptidoglycan/LPS O-acetylase OafA/YrhL, contains acyltransferase and SGNH-hydrolase domains [Haloechinothrix alba]|uniref:Peptidoglycan/LPS O-acetylase OafA/YrhL, contains acyltransferase and SGNH-hydrolase domains n=1 Tax=Haloechinothrix alba TaxID=664784 RepID=A0A238YAW4_9PSEU|nr:acyltransferase [Haloechinothrix alba]SNR68395.1 Peptidoglycan/LPS O-acetylase OafA/YrhL, contains acyltransferase and SGNH-hydrolase domains [Haloechinothrix alba]
MNGADRGRMYGLDLLRVLASLVVVYTHSANWFATRGHDWWLSTGVDRYVTAPLNLNPRLSFVGVAAFFLISGLVITHVAGRESGPLFLRRRASRILPLLFATTFAVWCLINLGLYVPESGQDSVNLADLILAATLFGFFTTPEVVLLGLAWTLLIQVVFYLYIGVTATLLRTHPWMPFAIAAAITTAGLSLGTGSEDVAVHRLGLIAAYLPILCIGALIALVHQGKVHPGAGTALGAVHFMLFVWADRIGEHLHTGDAHPRLVALMITIVVLVLGVRDRLSTSPVIKGWARRTYAIYLLHPLCLYPVLDQLVPVIGTEAALVIALVVLVAVVEAAHRWFEVPVDRWVRAREKPRAPDRAGAGSGPG